MSRRSARTRRKTADERVHAARPGRRGEQPHWIDRLGVWALALTAIALPLAFDPGSALVFSVPKAAVLGVAAYGLGAMLALKMLAVGIAAFPRTWLFVPVAVFLATMVLASVLAVDTSIALWGAYDRRLGLVASLEVVLIFLAAAVFVRERHDALTVLVGVGLGGALAFCYALAQRLGLDPIRWVDSGSVFSTFGNSNIMGHYFAVLAAASLAGLLSLSPLASRKGLAIVLATLSAAFLVGSALSGARAALVGLAIGATAAVTISVWRLLVDRGRRMVAAGIAFGAAVLGVGILLLTPVGARIATLAQGTDLSLGERSLLYRTILQIVGDRPLLGVGPDNLAAVYNAYRPVDALRFGPLLTQSSAHGWPWRVVLDAGAIGLLSFAAVVVALAVASAGRLRSSEDWRAPVLVVAVVTYLVAGFFAVNAIATDWLFWLAAGLLVAACTPHTVPAARPLRGWRVPLAIALAVGLLWPIVGLTRDIGASRALLASRTLAKRDVQGALTQARTAVANDDRWAVHWNTLGLRALAAGDRGLALSSFERASETGSYDPLIWKNLGTLQAQLARQDPALTERARESAERAVRADPRNPVARAGAAQIYVVLGDGTATAREAEAALVLAPGNDEYLELAAIGYLQARRTDEALVAIQRSLAIRETWQRRLLLARIYLVQDNHVGARTELRRVLQLNPANRDATRLLEQLQETGR